MKVSHHPSSSGLLPSEKYHMEDPCSSSGILPSEKYHNVDPSFHPSEKYDYIRNKYRRLSFVGNTSKKPQDINIRPYEEIEIPELPKRDEMPIHEPLEVGKRNKKKKKKSVLTRCGLNDPQVRRRVIRDMVVGLIVVGMLGFLAANYIRPTAPESTSPPPSPPSPPPPPSPSPPPPPSPSPPPPSPSPPPPPSPSPPPPSPSPPPPPPSPSPPPPPSTYDHLRVSLTWPFTYCLSNICGKRPSDDFSLHGLWPEYRNGTPTVVGRDDCVIRSGRPFSIDPKLEDSVVNLRQYWYPLSKRNDPHHFWTHEWQKHGYCATDKNMYEYFLFARRMRATWGDSKFIQQNISPSYTGYTINAIEAAIRWSIGARNMENVLVKCAPTRNSRHANLESFECCMDKVGTVISCPARSRHHSCSGKLIVMVPK